VYGGLAAETAATNAATWATAGQVVTYHGLPIDAVYEPDSGGYTASSADVWGTALPYLVARPEPPGYVSPNRWSIAIGAAALGRDAAAVGSPTGVVESLRVAAREALSGRVIGLLLSGPEGLAELRDDAVRTALGLPSNLFSVRTATAVSVLGAGGARTTLLSLGGAHVQGGAGVASVPARTTATIEGAGGVRRLATTAPSYTFVGRGLGPGLGMSQDGALYMASHGATADAILLYYYSGTRIQGNDGEGSA
jgi:stage II sporulation protein D